MRVTSQAYHEPVLCREVIDYLITDRSGLYLDGTVGGGGHAEAICRQLTSSGFLVCCDADEEAIRHTKERLRDFRERLSFVRSNFADLQGYLAALGRSPVRGILLDLGVSSHQLDEPTRGFSFRADASLDMRFDAGRGMGALDVLNDYTQERLAEVIFKYGEERAARRIARRIVSGRPLSKTQDLVAAVEAAVGSKFLTKTLARVFQAIRIEVNGELESLSRGLDFATGVLGPGGRLVVISYHSLEDRIVKTYFRQESALTIRSGHPLVPDTAAVPRLKVLTPRPVVPEKDEVLRNPRARSAKLRVAERVSSSDAA